MFVRYFEMLPISYEAADAALRGCPRDWLPELAIDAGRVRDRLLAEARLAPPATRLRSEGASLQVGAPLRLAETSFLPLSWPPERAVAPFPTLEGDLQLAPLGPAGAQLSFSAFYRRPDEVRDGAVDGGVLHRIIESTVKDFVDRVALAVQAIVASGRYRATA